MIPIAEKLDKYGAMVTMGTARLTCRGERGIQRPGFREISVIRGSLIFFGSSAESVGQEAHLGS